MIRRFHVHNFRCFENFELPLDGLSSVLIIGKNGSGKTTVGLALEILQKIARGISRIRDLITVSDFSQGRTSEPMRFELELQHEGRTLAYALGLEMSPDFREMRVKNESLLENGNFVFSLESGQVKLASGTIFDMESQLVGLPVIQEATSGPISTFSSILRKILILRPIPSQIDGSSTSDNAEPEASLTNLGAWFSELSVSYPGVYSTIEAYLRNVLPDFESLSNPLVGKGFRSLEVNFADGDRRMTLPFRLLSDGEKVFFITAMILAAKRVYPELICFWDEPDNNMSLDEVALQIVDLRRAFRTQGQLILTSHIDEAIRKFPRENILYMNRKSHLHPSQISFASAFGGVEDLVTALVEDDLPG